ncbi:MAG: hypothetical protein JRD68_00125 [Deltaproteobacteria bacterium]|nr:hypothetical protein [Deltaproteobacteria bacterium]
MAKWTVALRAYETPNNPGNWSVPGDVVHFKPLDRAFTWTADERKQYLIVTIEGLTEEQMVALREPVYDLTFRQHLKKHRFNFPFKYLRSIGVDERRMLDKKVHYSPELSALPVTACFDKYKNRFVLITDNLNPVDTSVAYQ